MGVDLFFALSGLLTAGILVDTKQSGGFFKDFNLRHCLRICPLCYSFLLGFSKAPKITEIRELLAVESREGRLWLSLVLDLEHSEPWLSCRCLSTTCFKGVESSSRSANHFSLGLVPPARAIMTYDGVLWKAPEAIFAASTKLFVYATFARRIE